MPRPTASRRTVLALAVPLALGTTIGLAAPTLWSASGETTSPGASAAAASGPSPSLAADKVDTGGAGSTTPPQEPSPATTTSPARGGTPLTLTDAMAVAAHAAPGRVIEAKEDTEVTGLTYDVTLVHPDGLVSELEVDAATGTVLSRTLQD